MCNPLPNEKALYEKIEKEKLTVPAVVWELLDHHLGNDLYVINLVVGSHLSGGIREPIPAEEGEKILARCEEIQRFLRKLKELTQTDV
jgi:hypothetical protein